MLVDVWFFISPVVGRGPTTRWLLAYWPVGVAVTEFFLCLSATSVSLVSVPLSPSLLIVKAFCVTVSFDCLRPQYSVEFCSMLQCLCRHSLIITRRTRLRKSFQRSKLVWRYHTRMHVSVVIFSIFAAIVLLLASYYICCHYKWINGSDVLLSRLVRFATASVLSIYYCHFDIWLC